MSPYFQQPLKMGADIVVHSTTKYLNGHSDSVGGAIMSSHPTLHAQLKYIQTATGGILSPFDSFLVLRGIKTLAVRMKKHEDNALQIAGFLQTHSKVKTVHYPGLPIHPQYALAQKQMSGFGGMLSFELKGNFQKAKKFLENLKIFSLGESLGGVESLIEHPGKMTHSALPREEKRKLGISDSLIRVSVGIEDIHDLIHDLNNAFQKV
jgi:cystathionine gamma-lyase